MVVKDVIDVCGTVVRHIDLFGVRAEFSMEFQRRVEEVGRTVCLENEIAYGTSEATCIPVGTTLGPESTKLFLELKSWLATQNTAFSRLVS